MNIVPKSKIKYKKIGYTNNVTIKYRYKYKTLGKERKERKENFLANI